MNIEGKQKASDFMASCSVLTLRHRDGGMSTLGAGYTGMNFVPASRE